MTGNELIKALQELSEEELECPVYVCANHRHSLCKQNYVSISHYTEYDLECCFVGEDEIQGYLEEGHEVKKFIEIS